MKKVFRLSVYLLLISLLISGCSSGSPVSTAIPTLEPQPTATIVVVIPIATATETEAETPPPALPEATLAPTEVIFEGPIVFEDATFQSLMESTFNKTEFFPEDFGNVTDLLIGADEKVILDAGYETYQFYYNPKENQDFTFAIDGSTFENAVGTIKTLSDLKYFKSLERLELIYHIEADLATLPALPNLNTLVIVIGKASGLEFLNQHKGLQRLDLYMIMESDSEPDMEPVRALTQLKGLGLMYIPFTNLDFLEGKTDLTQLAIGDAPVADFSKVASLTKLESVFIEMTNLKDVTPFMKLGNLKTLVLGYNQIDTEGLQKLKELQEAYTAQGKELYIDLLD